MKQRMYPIILTSFKLPNSSPEVSELDALKNYAWQLIKDIEENCSIYQKEADHLQRTYKDEINSCDDIEDIRNLIIDLESEKEGYFAKEEEMRISNSIAIKNGAL